MLQCCLSSTPCGLPAPSCSPLHWCVQLPPEEVAASKARSFARRTNALLRAAAAGDIASVSRMLERGVLPDSADYDRRTALMLAAANGHEVILIFVARNNMMFPVHCVCNSTLSWFVCTLLLAMGCGVSQ